MKFIKTFFLLLLLMNVVVSCKKTRGCTDPEAMNYNPDARKDDHSCYYFWVGQEYGGGKVFYVDQTGKHGLIALPFDLSPAPFGCMGTSVSTGAGVGNGPSNTESIATACGPSAAASICSALDTLGYDDWYLPSLQELKGLDETLGLMGEAQFGSGYYWTSTENDANTAWTIMMTNVTPVSFNKSTAYTVRPIRSF